MEHILLEAWRYALVAFGIGLVIFVHELGHFLAARWCGVRVETFSLGFGPKLLGWTRGSTTYQVAVVPLGGFVKMAGEESMGDPRSAAPDELPAKSVGQRFLIYSGGVVMNVVFGLVVFPFILAAGVPFAEPMLGPSLPGSPAWRAALEPGTRVISVNGDDVIAYHEIPNAVALGSTQETVLVVNEPGRSETRSVHLTPVYSETIGAYSIGVTPATDPKGVIQVAEDSSAYTAGLRDGDRLIAVDGTPSGLSIAESLVVAMQSGAPVTARFARDDQEFDATIAPEASAKYEQRLLGVARVGNHVLDVRETPLANAMGVRKDDRLLAVNGTTILKSIDVLRALQSHSQAPTIVVDRAGQKITLTGPVLSDDEAVQLWRAWAIVEDAGSARVTVLPRSAAAEAGLQDGDRIVAIGGKPVRTFDDILAAGKNLKEGETLTLAFQALREDAPLREVTLAARAFRPPVYGFGIRDAEYVYKTKGPIKAMVVGCKSTWKFLQDTWLTLKRILLGNVSSQNIGGIITIGVVSHSFASVGLTKLFYFLCMLSMNLAFLNVLPIPVLDGGHLFFLLVEKIKGSPVSERVLGYSQMVGVVLIVSLMVYVTFNDVVRWILPH